MRYSRRQEAEGRRQEENAIVDMVWVMSESPKR